MITLSFDNLAIRVKKAVGQGNSREVHLVTTKLSYKFQQKKKQDSEGQSRGPSHNNRGTIGKMVNTFEELSK